MEPIDKQISALVKEVDITKKKLKLAELAKTLDDLHSLSKETTFWQDSTKAQQTMQTIAGLERRLLPWQKIDKDLGDLKQLLELKDESLNEEITKQLGTIKDEYTSLKEQLKLSGPYDDHNAILSIYAGAGGTDAQDWTQILLRMYVRFAENNGLKVQTITQTSGDEAGIKSVTLKFSGDFTYGLLKGEHGVHRLVRLSPFNANNLRQTSFAKVEVLPEITAPEEAVIDEKDLQIDVFRSGGHGGQSVNTTDSAVRVTHLPSGISVVIQNERSQLQNREAALTILRSRLIQLQLEQHSANLKNIKGPNQSAEWGNQIRSYVMHPYKQVKDLRTRFETSDIDGVLDGNIRPLIDAYLDYSVAA